MLNKFFTLYHSYDVVFYIYRVTRHILIVVLINYSLSSNQ